MYAGTYGKLGPPAPSGYGRAAPWGAPWGAATVATDTAVVVGTAASAGLAAGGTALGATAVSTLTPLLAFAGVSAAVPVAGWIVGGSVALVAGTIALVRAIRAGKVRKAEAVAYAKSIGIPDPDKAPGFITRALRWSPQKRAKELADLMFKADKARAKDKAKGRKPSKADKLRIAKIRMLGTLDLVQRSAANGNEAPAAPVEQVEQAIPPDTYGEAEVANEAGTAPATAADTAMTTLGGSTYGVPNWALLAGGVAIIGGAILLGRKS